jgi:hypothetical protein
MFNGTRHNGLNGEAQQNKFNIKLIVIMGSVINNDFQYAKRYVTFIKMTVLILSAITLSVVLLAISKYDHVKATIRTYKMCISINYNL